MVFISKHYVSKPWARHEIKAAQAKQFLADSEYILPLRLDNSQLPGLAPTVGYIDGRSITAEKIVELIMEKLGRRLPRLFRGMDLGHDIDPLRSALRGMPPELFEEICTELLTCFKFQTASEVALESSILSRHIKIGKGSVRTGLFYDTFTYAQQLFTEFGYGVHEAASQMFGGEISTSSGGRVEELSGLSTVVIHSAVDGVPDKDDITAFGKELNSGSIRNAIFLINASMDQFASYFGAVDRPLEGLQLNPVVLFVEDLAFQVLTTDVYRRYRPRLEWVYMNRL